MGAAPGATACSSTTTSRASTRSPPAGWAAARSSTPTSCCARTPRRSPPTALPLAPADARRATTTPSHAMQRAERYPWADRTPKTRALLDAARQRRPAAPSARRWPSPSATRPGQPFDDGTRQPPRRARARRAGCAAPATSAASTAPSRRVDFTYLSAAVDAGARRAHAAARRTPCDRDGDGWRVRYRQHLAARDGHPEHLLDPVAARRARGARRPRRARGGHVRLDAACCCATAPRCPGSARAWARGFSGNGDLLLFLLDADRYLDPATGPVITASVRVPDARVARAGAGSSSRTPARPPSRSGCGRASRRPATCARALRAALGAAEALRHRAARVGRDGAAARHGPRRAGRADGAARRPAAC